MLASAKKILDQRKWWVPLLAAAVLCMLQAAGVDLDWDRVKPVLALILGPVVAETVVDFGRQISRPNHEVEPPQES